MSSCLLRTLSFGNLLSVTDLFQVWQWQLGFCKAVAIAGCPTCFLLYAGDRCVEKAAQKGSSSELRGTQKKM